MHEIVDRLAGWDVYRRKAAEQCLAFLPCLIFQWRGRPTAQAFALR
jgi:hypothetical protein